MINLSTNSGDFNALITLSVYRRNKISNLASHPGFDEKLCYGDITLEFCHVHAAGPFSKLDRENINKMKQDAEINVMNQTKKMTDSSAKIQQSVKR